MVNSKRTAMLPSSLDFDRLVGRDDEVSRDHLFDKYGMLLKNTDLLVDIIRQLTDINDKDREIVKKLENASYRKFAFRQIKRHVNVCLNDLIQVTPMIDEDFMTSRLQRMGEMIKKVMESWDIMLHGIEVIDRNPRISTTLPEEIKLFYELSSIDMKEFNISLGQLKDEIASRMSFCQLSSREELNVCTTYSLEQFKLDSIRFDKLSFNGGNERSTSKEDDKIKNGNKTLKRKYEEVTKNEENELETKSSVKRMRFCESENAKGVPAAVRPKIILESSCNDTFPYDYDPSEGCVIGKSISREDFIRKHEYITAWAECQSETCLNRNSANSASSFSGEDMDIDEISVEGVFSDYCSETKSCIAAESQLPSRDIEVSAPLGHSKTTQIHSDQRSTEFELSPNSVYSDCLKSYISDNVKQSTKPMISAMNKGLIRTQHESKSNLNSELKCNAKMSSKSDVSHIDSNHDKPNNEVHQNTDISGELNTKQWLEFSRQESESNVSLELNCCDELSAQSDCSTIDYNDMAIVTQGCNGEPNKEACRTSNDIWPKRESNILSCEPNTKHCLEFARQESKCSSYSELECCDNVSSQSDCSTIGYNDMAIVTQGCSDEPRVEACQTSNENLPEIESNKLSDQANSTKGLKIALQESNINLNSDLKCYDKVSSQSDIEKVDSKNVTRITQGCNDEPKANACQISNEIMPERNNIKLSDEVEVRKCLKITLVHKGCGIWAVKTSNKRKRSECDSDNCIDSMTDAQAILEEGFRDRGRVLKRVKLVLTNDSPSKKVKQGPVHTKKFKSLRRLATSLCELKSRIFRRPFLKKRATVTPILI